MYRYTVLDKCTCVLNYCTSYIFLGTCKCSWTKNFWVSLAASVWVCVSFIPSECWNSKTLLVSINSSNAYIFVCTCTAPIDWYMVLFHCSDVERGEQQRSQLRSLQERVRQSEDSVRREREEKTSAIDRLARERGTCTCTCTACTHYYVRLSRTE